MEERNDFYVYVHTRATDGSIFYVGKGKGKRAWSKYSRNKHWKHIVAKHGYNVVIVQRDLTEGQSLELEVMLIADIGKENLCNLTDGGEGVSGLVHSEEHRRKNSEAKKGRPAHNKGKKISEELKAHLREINIGRKRSDETRKKMSEAQKGSKKSPESIAKSVAGRARSRALKTASLLQSLSTDWQYSFVIIAPYSTVTIRRVSPSTVI